MSYFITFIKKNRMPSHHTIDLHVRKCMTNVCYVLPFIGYPRPSVVWMKEDEDGKRIAIQDDDKYITTKQSSRQLQEDEFWYTLLVKDVQAKDYATYFCIGTNRLGSDETSIVLFGEYILVFNKRLACNVSASRGDG
jgi:hypothetical protein